MSSMRNKIKKSTLALFGGLILEFAIWIVVFIILGLLFPNVSHDTILLHTMGILYLAWIITFIAHKRRQKRPQGAKETVFPKI